MPYASAGGAVASSAARPGLSVRMPLPGRVPSADREFSRALPRHKKIRVLQCHRGFHGWTCQGPELNFYVTRFPKTKMQAGHSVLVTGFTARLPARLDPPPEPRYRRRTGTEPAPGPAGMPPREKPGTGPHDTAGRHGTRRRGPHARAGNPVVGPACSSGA